MVRKLIKFVRLKLNIGRLELCFLPSPEPGISSAIPLHHRLQARQARLARELGRIDDAKVIESELAAALAYADPEHPILQQLRENQELPLQPE